MKFIEVTKRRVCIICSKNSWCTYSLDGGFVICRRQNDTNAKVKSDKNGNEYYLYKVGE